LVQSLKRKTFQKLKRYPDLVDPKKLQSVRTLAEFDDLVTAPVHGFKDAKEYWAKSSAAPFLPRIRRPTLLINAMDDPFLPAAALPVQEVAKNSFLTGEFPASGGHLGFLSGGWPGVPIPWAEVHAAEFLAQHLN
ncbi:MAG: alpha/beta hydrolase, partial [Candidatus Omnitrophica bacterium]|nr:alpha/beta hydrolase [Candidatus Omnitrophota bacterium]